VGAQTTGAQQPSDAWKIGDLWVALTLGFEFLAGHYVFGNSWRKLLEDCDVLEGRIGFSTHYYADLFESRYFNILVLSNNRDRAKMGILVTFVDV
jgi:hypothetical protein